MPREGQETTHETPTLTLGNKQSSLNKRTQARDSTTQQLQGGPNSRHLHPNQAHVQHTVSAAHCLLHHTSPRFPAQGLKHITRQRLTFPHHTSPRFPAQGSTQHHAMDGAHHVTLARDMISRLSRHGHTGGTVFHHTSPRFPAQGLHTQHELTHTPAGLELVHPRLIQRRAAPHTHHTNTHHTPARSPHTTMTLSCRSN